MLTFIWLAAISALAISYGKDKARTGASIKRSFSSLKNLAPGLLGMIAAVGLVLAAIPEDQLIRLFSIHSLWGFILVSLVGAIITIPGPIAFPLAGALLTMGAAPAALASFITTLTMVGLVTAPLETSYFGIRFVILRQSLSFIAAVVIGLMMGVLL
jgi:uncharacterized membrane protein YraQ (UPF0718 family)